ncbi:MAG: glucose-6-phosphate isomerase [Anaerolineae bacterium SM23_ 63]|nr:MAG: glucose-6-phosphate isomerase [Anaerolineae bacterium SM23_ 63]HEY46238.1 glucose-6-phosphate isomerase [Anaerolineae bacterium]
MVNRPFTLQLLGPQAIPSRYDHHITRHLSALKNQFHDQDAYHDALNVADMLLYEVFEIRRPELPGELLFGVTVIHPGKVGDEFFMTKGHFHSVLETAELYYCLDGEGVLVMESLEGDWAVEEFYSGSVTFVPPRWAHRSVNTSLDGDLILFFAYPAHAGHDYKSIEEHGFRKLILDGGDTYEIVDNPRWLPPERR